VIAPEWEEVRAQLVEARLGEPSKPDAYWLGGVTWSPVVFECTNCGEMAYDLCRFEYTRRPKGTLTFQALDPKSVTGACSSCPWAGRVSHTLLMGELADTWASRRGLMVYPSE
jgi:hypothetical protein